MVSDYGDIGLEALQVGLCEDAAENREEEEGHNKHPIIRSDASGHRSGARGPGMDRQCGGEERRGEKRPSERGQTAATTLARPLFTTASTSSNLSIDQHEYEFCSRIQIRSRILYNNNHPTALLFLLGLGSSASAVSHRGLSPPTPTCFSTQNRTTPEEHLDFHVNSGFNCPNLHGPLDHRQSGAALPCQIGPCRTRPPGVFMHSANAKMNPIGCPDGI